MQHKTDNAIESLNKESHTKAVQIKRISMLQKSIHYHQVRRNKNNLIELHYYFINICAVLNALGIQFYSTSTSTYISFSSLSSSQLTSVSFFTSSISYYSFSISSSSTSFSRDSLYWPSRSSSIKISNSLLVLFSVSLSIN